MKEGSSKSVATFRPNEFVAKFQAGRAGHWPPRSETTIKEQATVAFRSLHPAFALVYEESNLYHRNLLIFHFILAFAELDKHVDPPDWVKVISRKSHSSVEYSSGIRDWRDPTGRAIELLSLILEIPNPNVRRPFLMKITMDQTELDQKKKKKDALETLIDSLRSSSHAKEPIIPLT
jgi:hypothetical protein